MNDLLDRPDVNYPFTYGRWFSLSQRWNDFNEIKIQRDIYSAFLIMNIADDFKKKKYIKGFDTSLILSLIHSKE